MDNERGRYEQAWTDRADSMQILHCPACSFFDRRKHSCHWRTHKANVLHAIGGSIQ